MSSPPTLRPGSDDHESVMALQRALNKALVPSPQLGLKGNFKGRTEQAVKDFQLSVGLYPDGVVGPKTWTALKARGFAVPAPGASNAVRPPVAPTGDAKKDAPWMEIARGELVRRVIDDDGHEVEVVNREQAGVQSNNPRIVEYLHTYAEKLDKYPLVSGKRVPLLGADGKPVLTKKGKPRTVDSGVFHDSGPEEGERMTATDVDETAWCSAFVGWVMKQAGKSLGDTNALAASWKSWGVALKEPRYGCVVVVQAPTGKADKTVTTSGFHVAFFVSGDAAVGGTGKLVLLGGNQSDKEGKGKKRKTVSGGRVSEASSSSYWTVRAYRWPA